MKIRKLIASCLCAACILALTGCEEEKIVPQKKTDPVALPTSEEALTIGIWNGSYHVFDDMQMNQLKDAGISLIIGVDEQWTGGGGILGVMERARLADIKIITDFRQWDKTTVPSYAGHPAHAGYLMWDEPSTMNLDSLKETKEAFENVMPEGSYFFINLLGSAASYPSLYGEEKYYDYETVYVDQFVEELELETLAYDSYGVLDGGTATRPCYYNNLGIMATTAKENGIPFQFTFLSAGHKTTDAVFEVPTAEQLRWQMALGLTFGAKELVHYVYTSHEEGYETMVDFNSLSTTPLYEDIKAVNLEYLAWDENYRNYEWVGVANYDQGTTNEALNSMEHCIPVNSVGGIKDIDADGDLLIGLFEDANDSVAFMITNAGETVNGGVHNKLDFMMENLTATLTFDKGCKSVAVIRKGETEFYELASDNTFTMEVDSYEGVFVIPIYD